MVHLFPQHSIGGSYFGWGWRSQAVQRLKNQTHVGTLATPGARSEGENGLQCEILGLLQQGCLGRRVLRDEQGARSEEEVRWTIGVVVFRILTPTLFVSDRLS